MTWAQFLEVAEQHGVELRETREPVATTGETKKYLYREVDGVANWVALPLDFSEDDRVGAFRFHNVCRRLNLLPVIEHFPGWPVIL